MPTTLLSFSHAPLAFRRAEADTLGVDDFVPLQLTVQEGVCFMQCGCGFAVRDDGPGGGDRCNAAFMAHVCPPSVPSEYPACDVYWGSHGCDLARGHEGPCRCDCADDLEHDPVTRLDANGVMNVGACPYYGPETNFYGDDATDERKAQLARFIAEMPQRTGDEPI